MLDQRRTAQPAAAVGSASRERERAKMSLPHFPETHFPHETPPTAARTAFGLPPCRSRSSRLAAGTRRRNVRHGHMALHVLPYVLRAAVRGESTTGVQAVPHESCFW
jgi:hypothetical protein